MTDPLAKHDAPRTPRNRALTAARGALHSRLTSPEWLARTSAVALSVLSIAFAIGFGVVFAEHGVTLFVSNLPTIQAVLVLPYLVAVLAFGTAVGAVLAWRNGWWSRLGRIHQTALAVIGLAFVRQLAALGFLP